MRAKIPVSMTLTEWEWIVKSLLIDEDDEHCEEKVRAVTKFTLRLSVIKTAVHSTSRIER